MFKLTKCLWNCNAINSNSLMVKNITATYMLKIWLVSVGKDLIGYFMKMSF